MDEIIIVSGLPRSGTSMMMEMLKSGGIHLLTDNQRKADDDNPRGYYEYEKVKKLPVGEFDWLTEAVGKAVKVISPLLLYLPDKFQYKVLLMKREIDEVLSSQNLMLKGNEQDIKIGDEKMRKIFTENIETVISFMDLKTNFSYLICDYNEILLNPLSRIEHIASFLDLSHNISAMVKIVDPALYRHQIKKTKRN